MILRSTTAHTNAIQWNSDQKLPFESIANKAPSVEVPVLIKENLEYAGIVIVPIFILLLMVPKQLPDFGISSIELYTRLSEENLLLKLLFVVFKSLYN